MQRKKVISDVAWGIGSKVLAMALFMLTDIIIARALSLDKYGEWAFFYSVLGVSFIIARFGINGAIQFFVAKESEIESQKQIITSGTVLRVAAGAVLSIVLGVLFAVISPRIGYPDKYPDLVHMFLLMPAIVLGNSIVDYFKNISAALLDLKRQFAITVLEYLGLFLVIIWLMYLENDVLYIVVGYAASYLLCVLACFYIYRHKFTKKINIKEFVPILKYAITIFATGVISTLLMDMDTFMLGIFSANEEVGIYSIAKSLINKGTNFSVAFAMSTMATFAILNSSNIKEKRRFYKRINTVNTIVLIMASLCCFFLGKTIIVLLYGNLYKNASVILKILIPYFLFFSMSIFPASFLAYQKLAKKTLGFNVITFIINLILNLALIPKYGSVGAGIATDIAIFPYFIFLFFAVHKCFKRIDK